MRQHGDYLAPAKLERYALCDALDVKGAERLRAPVPGSEQLNTSVAPASPGHRPLLRKRFGELVAGGWNVFLVLVDLPKDQSANAVGPSPPSDTNLEQVKAASLPPARGAPAALQDCEMRCRWQ